MAHIRPATLLARSVVLALALLMAHSVAPAQAQAADLFPVDDWVGDGLGEVQDFAFGGLELGAEAIANLIVTTIAAIVDLLIPKSLIESGLTGIKWICTVPAFSGGGSAQDGAILTLPHVDELRTTMQWFGVTLLPLGLLFAAARYFIPGSAYDDGPLQILGNVVIAAGWLAFYLWGWTAITGASSMVSDGILSMPWVADGVEDMMEGLSMAGGAAGPFSEFAVLIVMLLAAIALVGLLLLKVALLVVTAFLFVIGGLIGALLPFPFGRRLVQGYLVAVAAVVALPALWAVLFALGSALMLDVSSAGNNADGFEGFMQQFFVMAASFATFGVAIKLGFQAFGSATSTIASFTTGGLAGAVAGGGGSGPGISGTAHKAATFNNMKGGGLQRQAAFAGGSPRSRAGGASVQSTRESAEGLRGAVSSSGGTAAATTAATAAATGGASAAAGAAGAAARGGAAQGTATLAGTAAQRAPQAAASARTPGGSEGQAPMVPTSHSGAPVRSTAVDGDGPRLPGSGSSPADPGSRQSARQTAANPAAGTQAPDLKTGGASPKQPRQDPPRGPRRSQGGKR